MLELIPLPPAGEKSLTHLPAPAKINTFLHIIGRRPDGYHLLQSVFALVDWVDYIHVHQRPNGISRQDLNPACALPAEDLMVRAAQALQQATGCTLGAHIEIQKHIPMQAGLGGGSSNAATCLIALNRLWQLGLSRTQLIQVGAKLGADVPFFLGGTNAWVEGVGERLTPVALPPAHVTIVKPPRGVSTAEIFASALLTRNSNPATISDFTEHGRSTKDGWQPYSFGQNDLQEPAVSVCHDIQDALNWLSQFGLTARMTGSGSAVFAVHPKPVATLDAPPEWVTHQGRVLVVHPLKNWFL